MRRTLILLAALLAPVVARAQTPNPTHFNNLAVVCNVAAVTGIAASCMMPAVGAAGADQAAGLPAGDGVTDDTLGFQTFLDAHPGQTIVLPCAKYLIDTDDIVVPVGTHLVGSGSAITEQQKNLGCSQILLNPTYSLIPSNGSWFDNFTIRRKGLLDNPTDTQLAAEVATWADGSIGIFLPAAVGGTTFSNMAVFGFNVLLWADAGQFLVDHFVGDGYNGIVYSRGGAGAVIRAAQLSPMLCTQSTNCTHDPTIASLDRPGIAYYFAGPNVTVDVLRAYSFSFRQGTTVVDVGTSNVMASGAEWQGRTMPYAGFGVSGYRTIRHARARFIGFGVAGTVTPIEVSSNSGFTTFADGRIAIPYIGPISAVTTGYIEPETASITASIAATTMTVTAIGSGTLVAGGTLSDVTAAVAPYTKIVTQLTGSAGGTGTYTVSISQTVGSTTIDETYGQMTISAVASGTIGIGDILSGATTVIVPRGIIVSQQLSGSAGGVGVYAVEPPWDDPGLTVGSVGSQVAITTHTDVVTASIYLAGPTNTPKTLTLSGTPALGDTVAVTITGATIPTGAATYTYTVTNKDLRYNGVNELASIVRHLEFMTNSLSALAGAHIYGAGNDNDSFNIAWPATDTNTVGVVVTTSDSLAANLTDDDPEQGAAVSFINLVDQVQDVLTPIFYLAGATGNVFVDAFYSEGGYFPGWIGGAAGHPLATDNLFMRSPNFFRPPTLSTGCLTVGNDTDLGGIIREQVGTTGCTVTFNIPFPWTPNCTVQGIGVEPAAIDSVTPYALTWSNSAVGSAQNFSYKCPFN